MLTAGYYCFSRSCDIRGFQNLKIGHLTPANSNISVIDEASDFKFGMQLRFAKAHYKIPLEEKWLWPL